MDHIVKKAVYYVNKMIYLIDYGVQNVTIRFSLISGNHWTLVEATPNL